MEIDYKANAVHALNVLMKHGSIRNDEAALVEFTTKVLSGQYKLQSAFITYECTLRELRVTGYEPIPLK